MLTVALKLSKLVLSVLDTGTVMTVAVVEPEGAVSVMLFRPTLITA